MKSYLLSIFALVVFFYSCDSGRPGTTIPKVADLLKGTFWDHTLAIDVRVDSLVNQLTLEEKCAQMMHEAPAIPIGGMKHFMAWHVEYLKKLRLKRDNKKPFILVVTGGSPIDLSEVDPYFDAILFAWYPGEQGGML